MMTNTKAEAEVKTSPNPEMGLGNMYDSWVDKKRCTIAIANELALHEPNHQNPHRKTMVRLKSQIAIFHCVLKSQ